MPKEAGRVTLIDPDKDKPLAEYGMSQCCHCGGQFPTPRFGANDEDKKTRVGRGFCQNCNGYVCGASCVACVPVDLLLTNIEKGRPLDFRPVVVPTFFPGE